MQINLSSKERMLLEDEKSQEEVCVQKYTSYAQQANDLELKQLFTQLASEEQHHYDTLNQILQGQQPNMNHNSQNTTQVPNSKIPNLQGAMNNNNDKVLCSDLLATEKYVSGTYDVAIFECANPMVRQALEHIQKDEHKHGQQLFNYMNSHGMYTVK